MKNLISKSVVLSALSVWVGLAAVSASAAQMQISVNGRTAYANSAPVYLNARVGQRLDYTWNSSGVTNIYSYFDVDSDNPECGYAARNNAWGTATTVRGQNIGSIVPPCQSGHTYYIHYTGVDARTGQLLDAQLIIPIADDGSYPRDPRYPNPRDPRNPPMPRDPGYPGDPGYPSDPGYPNDPGYPSDPGYPNGSSYSGGVGGLY